MVDIEPIINAFKEQLDGEQFKYWKEYLEEEVTDLCLSIEASTWNPEQPAMLLIVRGLPGAGKSTFSKYLSKAYGFKIVEADAYLMEDGVYKFDPKKLGWAHNQCREAVREYLQQGENIVVCNTSTQRWEMQPYIDMGCEAHYIVKELVLRTSFGNIHGVPEDKIEVMRKRWED
jgi:hypothetical protein